MNTPTARLSCCSAPACAGLITAAIAWAFVSSTASTERDPFRFASTMAAHARQQVEQTGASPGNAPAQALPVYAAPDLLAVAPPCLGTCA